jgi:hypothetical protein
MLGSLIAWRQPLEILMLLCFGASWPFSIARSLRTQRVDGKSPVFLTLVMCGYIIGVATKLIMAVHDGGWPEAVTALYAFNALLVLTDLLLYIRFRTRPDERQGRPPQP